MIYLFFFFFLFFDIIIRFSIISFLVLIAIRSPDVMTTSRILPEYYTSDEFAYDDNAERDVQQNTYPNDVSNHINGVITNKTRSGSYNIVEKDYDDHKVIYHIPIEYGDDYDLSELENMPTVEEEEEEQQQRLYSPKLVRRRIYRLYPNDDDVNDDYEYVEEVPITAPIRRVYVSPRQPRTTKVVEQIYEPQPVTETVEYIYDNDYDPRRENEEEVEYVVRERAPNQTVRLNDNIHSVIMSTIFWKFYDLLLFYFSMWKNPDLFDG